MSWLSENKEVLFGGAGVASFGFVMNMLFSKKGVQEKTASAQSNGTNTNNIDININNNVDSSENNSRINPTEILKTKKTLDDFKNETRILFIDDDTRFKVAGILVRSGWVHTKLIKDCEALDDKDIVDASILFIDVQGVGVAMGFADEGLGLALAIKKKYTNKKVIIYSAETKGDRFHEALKRADSFLAKNADPYEFQSIVEEFTIGADC